jgi:hypothetical protein
MAKGGRTMNKIEKVKTELNYIIEYLEEWNMDHLQTQTLKDAISVIDELDKIAKKVAMK